MKRVKLAAHRGYSAEYPENTLAAFDAALKLDVDMLETDVRLTADDRLILLHDRTLDRTTDSTGVANDMRYSEIAAADAGVKKADRFRGERVPLFSDFLELVKSSSLELNVELKDYPADLGARAYESCDRVIAMIRSFGLADRVYINSFSGELLRYVDDKYDHKFRLHGFYPAFLLGDGEPEYERMFCVCLFNKYIEDGKVKSYENPVCDRSAFEYFTERGIEPWVYYRQDREEYLSAALKNGAVGVTSNDPVAAAAILKKYGYR